MRKRAFSTANHDSNENFIGAKIKSPERKKTKIQQKISSIFDTDSESEIIDKPKKVTTKKTKIETLSKLTQPVQQAVPQRQFGNLTNFKIPKKAQPVEKKLSSVEDENLAENVPKIIASVKPTRVKENDKTKTQKTIAPVVVKHPRIVFDTNNNEINDSNAKSSATVSSATCFKPAESQRVLSPQGTSKFDRYKDDDASSDGYSDDEFPALTIFNKNNYSDSDDSVDQPIERESQSSSEPVRKSHQPNAVVCAAQSSLKTSKFVVNGASVTPKFNTLSNYDKVLAWNSSGKVSVQHIKKGWYLYIFKKMCIISFKIPIFCL